MAKNKKHKPKGAKHAPKFRNASGVGKSKGIGDTLVEALERTGASAAGGAASALIGGLAVSNSVVEPETFGLIATVGGAALASRSDSKWREVFNGAAAAGAGQLVLGYMAKRALNSGGKSDDKGKSGDKPKSDGAPASKPSNAADADGYVVQMFRDMAGGLDGYYAERARNDERMRYVDEPDVIVVQGAA
jgi:hypothetical protein